MKRLFLVSGLFLVLERIWKHWLVVRFFRRPQPALTTRPSLVSILQPVLSGDPTMIICLERSLMFSSDYEREWIWIADEQDLAGQQICQELMSRYTHRRVHLLTAPPAPEGENPKVFKLIEGMKVARGEIICVLDDDTMLPDWSLEKCLPYLDQPGVGLAFGLPYYVNFSGPWSSMVATFVNSNSLLTYIPYTTLTAPFTINGMFYTLRRSVLEQVGGFEAIREIFADDFAVGNLLRSYGYKLAQTPVLHAISTEVKGPRHYLSLIQRWFVLPRESLLRHLNWYERLLVYTLGLASTLCPFLLVVLCFFRPSRKLLAYTLCYFSISFASINDLNTRYLQGALPRKKLWWVPVMQIIFPLQLLVALFSPQRINWRGNVIEVARGGNFRYLKRRKHT